MTLSELKGSFENHQSIKETIEALQYSEKKMQWKGHVGSSLSISVNSVASQVPGNHVIVLTDKEEAAYFLNDLQELNQQANHILFFPETSRVPYQVERTDNANLVARAETLERINETSNCLIVTYPNALSEFVVAKKVLNKNSLVVEKDKTYSIDFLNELLIEYGFEKVDFVYQPGQFSVRGGIVDVFSYVNDHPFRIEFFGDEVDSIRTFNPVDQLSITTHTKMTIVPNVQDKILEEEKVSFFEFLPEQSTIWIKDAKGIRSALKKMYDFAKLKYDELPESPVKRSAPAELFFNPNDVYKKLDPFNVIEFGTKTHYPSDTIFQFDIIPQPSFNKNFELLKENITTNIKAKIETVICSNQPKQIERLYAIFEDSNLKVEFSTVNIALHEGFSIPSLQLACYTDHQIFERYHRFKLKEGFRQTDQALTMKEIYDLQKGDFVTHIDHGVGRFSGLEMIDVNGKQQEAVRLVYKDNDVLYVSIHSLHRISRFTGKDGTVPKMNKLGTQAWANLKKKTKKKIKEVAFDLIQLYAKRKSQPGFAFAPDTYLQTELEASFMYEDTPDQLKATEAVKRDMESPAPMDRLICGDVGFGKTEIAIRAAFKAVADSKQVAVLVPTTILSLQHYRSFKERFKDFPCKVDYINRFKSAKQVTETLKKLAEGEIDILVGTHKIVGKNVKFKDLGLMIIDEEQKFGVSVKDKLKTFRETVDTLTLTATPIPRTLQFSLMGARDLSIINTPPPNRQPVLTEVIQFNEEAIRDAIAYEISRGGQVYFVHNRLQNIQEVSGMIQRLCPGVRVAIGHGQMDGKKLEKIMMDFIDHEYDVLLATTIIESGIDISNANTIIINNANNFGLSDLHQLRGRVGRSNKKGFCYLIAPKMHMLTSEARKRLEALVQFSDLGSGFNIAMRDLDIRGAGNLLGAEQSGFISDIGIETYQKILNEALEELKETEFKQFFEEQKKEGEQEVYVRDCVLETDLEIRIPEDYVNQVAERLSLYRELDGFTNEEQITKFAEDLKDRFGALPEATEELIDSMKLRWMAQEIGFEKLVLKSNKMIGYFVANQESSYYQSPLFTRVLKYMQTNPPAKMSEKNNKLRLIYGDVKSIKQAMHNIKQILVQG